MIGEPGARPAAGAWVDGTSVIFRVADPGGRLAGVRLQQEVRIPGHRLGFGRDGDGWKLAVARPPVHRMEYLLELSYRDGGQATVTDPANPRQAPNPFGVKSVLEFPGYRPPEWLSSPAGGGREEAADMAGPGETVPVRTWAPADAPDHEPLPLLVAHDGPEYATLAGLTRYLAAGVAGRWLPRLRAALLGPRARDRWYSADPGYARALVTMVLPALAARLATTVRIGMGTSLGALAMLHAHCRYPRAFDGLFLQSGSFFTPGFDAHEQWFPYYQRITGFTAGVHAGGLPERPVPVVLTCGAIEENLGCNQLVARALRDRGYPADLREVPDMHNWTAWRDAFHPHLTGLVGQVSG